MPQATNDVGVTYQVGSFQFDPAQRELRSGSGTTPLPIALNKLLLLFVTRPGTIVTRDDIARALWENHTTIDVTNGINSAISRLRTQFSSEAGDGLYIETVVGSGYRLKAPVNVLVPETPEPDEVTLPSPAPAPRRWPFFATAGVLSALGIAALSYWAHAGKATAKVTHPPTVPLLGVRMISTEEAEDNLSSEAISLSGTYVAYSDRNGIALQNVSTRETRYISPPFPGNISHLSWFPDESHLLATETPIASTSDSHDHAWLIDLGGNPRQQILDDASIATLSPDGTRIAFLRNKQSELWLADATGNDAHRLFAANAGDTYRTLLWSPDGRRLIVDRLTSLSDAPANKNNLRETNQRWTYEARDITDGRILASYPDLQFSTGAVLRDGRILLLLGMPDQEKRLAELKTDPQTNAILSPPDVVAPNPSNWSGRLLTASSFSASQDGRRFSAILEQRLRSVYTADLTFSGGTPSLENIHRLIKHVGGAYPTGWSPDGKRVVFDTIEHGPSIGDENNINMVQFDPASATRYNGFAQFTPDGKWILYMRFSRPSVPTVAAIERLPANGGASIELSIPGTIEEFQCSRSNYGACVVREIEDKKALVYYALDPILGRGAELARTPWKPYGLGDWKLSPDGKTVATANHDPAHPAIELISLATGPHGEAPGAVSTIPVPGFGTVNEAIWSADGKYFFVQSNTASSANLLYVDHAGHGKLLRQSQHSIWAVPTRDGKKIAFPDESPPIRNVWAGDSQ